MSTLLVASTGGHLKELHRLRPRLEKVEGPYRWVTFDTAQSRSLLASEEVEFVPFVGGRDPANVARNLGTARRILRDFEPDAVLSTGSAVALPFFALARARRLPCRFIESAARIEGPSLTGRLIAGIPGVDRYTQYRSWSGGAWKFGGSVFDSFAPQRRDRDAGAGLARVVVSLGTYRGYDFSRLVERLLRVLPAETEVLWQTGDTDVSRFGIDAHYAIPESELSEAMREADAVVAHAGVGTALAAFEVGHCPLLIPRRFAFGEHVDDHQIQICEDLMGRGLALSVDASELSHDDLLEAASRSVRSVEPAPPADGPKTSDIRTFSAHRRRTLPIRDTAIRAVRGGGTALRRVNASRRPLPAFLIVGAQKAGTTSLHEYLCEHPQVSSSTVKEVHYFDLAYGRGASWYRAHFPIARGPNEIAGEASPYYLFHPLVPERVARDLPSARLIVLLRNPIERAYSHHNHERALGFEQLDFDEAIAREAERLQGEEERILRDPGYCSFSHQHHSYLARGRYAEQLERWFGRVGRERILVLSAEELFAEPYLAVESAQRFLGLEPQPPDDVTARNARSYAPLGDERRRRLRDEFEPHNRQLYELVGRDFGWD